MRAVGLVLATAIAVWALLLVDVHGVLRPRGANATALPTRDATPQALQAERARSTSRSTPATGRDAQSWPARMLGKLGDVLRGPRPPAGRSPANPAEAPASGAARASGAVGAVATEPTPPPFAAGELGEGALSPELRELERSHATEERDPLWAPEMEQRVQALFDQQPWLAPELALLNCQSSTCRLVVEDMRPEQAEQLLYLPGLRALTGLGPGSPYSLRAGQLSLYFRRGDEAAGAAREDSGRSP